MRVKCIKAFGYCKPGDLAEVPDGAAVDPEHWQIAPPAPPPPPPADPPKPPAAAAPAFPAKEAM